MNSTEARRKLAGSGFAILKDYAGHEVWGFGNISVRVSTANKGDDPQLTREVTQALNRQRVHMTNQSKPLTVKMSDQFKNAKRHYTCGTGGCHAKFTTPEFLAEHRKTHAPPPATTSTPAPSRPFADVLGPGKLGPAAVGYRRFSATERKSISNDLKSLVDVMTYEEIAKKWNMEKRPSPNGIPWSEKMIGNFVCRTKRMKRRNAERRKAERELSPGPATVETVHKPTPQSPVATPSKTGNKLSVPASIQLMMDDTELSIEQKVAVLTAAKIQIPASLQLVLEDPALDTEQKHRIFMMLIGVK